LGEKTFRGLNVAYVSITNILGYTFCEFVLKQFVSIIKQCCLTNVIINIHDTTKNKTSSVLKFQTDKIYTAAYCRTKTTALLSESIPLIVCGHWISSLPSWRKYDSCARTLSVLELSQNSVRGFRISRITPGRLELITCWLRADSRPFSVRTCFED